MYIYNGSSEAFTIYLWGDAPFLVIISMQKFFIPARPDSYPGYGSTMPVPIPDFGKRFADAVVSQFWGGRLI
ncbi:unnamed protein product [Gongylonema pulchrum]|uniref:Lipoprotein n=1 Tax=Gongylonema pulchrum TaxID=637853 RepID=A0A183D8G7_9BILA|nr:unnamed protein product [Gongylonema pulchrum]